MLRTGNANRIITMRAVHLMRNIILLNVGSPSSSSLLKKNHFSKTRYKKNCPRHIARVVIETLATEPASTDTPIDIMVAKMRIIAPIKYIKSFGIFLMVDSDGSMISSSVSDLKASSFHTRSLGMESAEPSSSTSICSFFSSSKDVSLLKSPDSIASCLS